MKVYRTDNQGFFVCEEDAFFDPIENKYILKSNQTSIPPPSVSVNQIAKFNNGEWSIVYDYRGVKFYKKLDGSVLEVTTADTIPSNEYTIIPPPNPLYSWVNESWVLDPIKVYDFELYECYRKRRAEYPTAEQFLDAYFDGGEAGIEQLRKLRLAVKAKYPKPIK